MTKSRRYSRRSGELVTKDRHPELGLALWCVQSCVLSAPSRMFAVPLGFPEVDYFQAAAAQCVEGAGGAGG